MLPQSMQSSISKSQGPNNDYLFSLKYISKQPRTHYLDTSVDFSPTPIESSLYSNYDRQPKSSMPKVMALNNQIFTCFLSEHMQPFHPQNVLLASHKMASLKVETEKQIEELMLVKSPKNMCNVCRCQFQDYLEHSQDPYHKKKIRQNDYNRKIPALIEILERRKKETKDIVKKVHQKSCFSSKLSQTQKSKIFKEADQIDEKEDLSTKKFFGKSIKELISESQTRKLSQISSQPSDDDSEPSQRPLCITESMCRRTN